MIINELSNIWPKLSEEEFKELCEDIKKNGLLEPIATYKFKDEDGNETLEIIDGRHRYLACVEVGVEPRFEEYLGSDVKSYVVSKNNMRRHLSTSQRAMVGASIWNIELGTYNQHTNKNIEGSRFFECTTELNKRADVADKLNISGRSLDTARVIKKNAIPEIEEGVLNGEMTLNYAKQIAILPKEEQKEIANTDGDDWKIKARNHEIQKAKEKAERIALEEKRLNALYDGLPEVNKISVIEDFKNSYKIGNCLENLKNIEDNSVDLILTDPPYGQNYKNQRKILKTLPADFGIANDSDNDANSELFENVAKECYRILKPGNHLYWFGNIKYIYEQIPHLKNAGFNILNILVWKKNNHGTPQPYGYSPIFEVIVYANKSVTDIKGCTEKNRGLIGGTPCDILEFSKVNILKHPHEKPQELLQFLIGKSSEPGELVVDPFAGSGSTLMASLNMKRRALGWELSPENHEVALQKWIADCVKDQE